MKSGRAKLHINMLSLFPEPCQAWLATSIVGRAQRRGLLDVEVVSPRDYAGGRHRVVDDRPYGGGPGMVMAAPPMAAAIDVCKARLPQARILMTSPQGRRIDQAWLKELSEAKQLIILCGHYEGIDERIAQLYQPEEFSVGDYVLSGGELPAMTLIDGVTRLLPGALGHQDSAIDDSFSGDEIELDHPCYTRPVEFRGLSVPEVLSSGDHAAIESWRAEQRQQRTRERRPDLEEC